MIGAAMGARWYTTDWHRWELPCSQFTHECALDQRILDGTHELRIRVRKFIEEQLTDTVVLDYLDLTYYYQHANYSGGYQIKHGYDRFFFESEESAIMFKLQFGEHCTDVKLRWKDTHHVPSGKEDQDPCWTKQGRQF